MTITKIFTAAIITIAASTSLAATKCDHKGNSGLFANTNPTVVKTQVAKVGTASSQTGTR